MTVEAVPALRGLLVDEGLLHRAGRLRRAQPFEGGDGVPGRAAHGYRAGARGHAVDQDGARAAFAQSAAELGPVQAQVVAQDVKQRGVGVRRHRVAAGVDLEREVASGCKHGDTANLDAARQAAQVIRTGRRAARGITPGGAPAFDQRLGVHVVAEAPVRVFVGAQPCIVVRYPLHAAGAFGAVVLVQAEGGGMVLQPGLLEDARQHGGVLDRHGRALRHVRLHRVAGVAQQHDAAAAPQRQRIAFEQGPFGNLGRGLDERLHGRMPAGEGCAHFLLAAGHPALAHVPLLFGHAGHVIDLIALAGDEVNHHMAIVRPPLDAHVERQRAAVQRRGEHRAVRHVAGVLGQLGAQQVFAQPGIDAVGADHDLGFLDRAVGEMQAHHVVVLVHARQALVELQQARRQGGGHQGMEVAAVHRQVRGAVMRDRVVAQRNAGQLRAGLPVAAVPVVRMRALAVELVLDADAPHDLHHVGAEMDACPQEGEGRRLLVQAYIEAGARHERRARGTAETGADDSDSGFALHGVSPGVRREAGLRCS
ncbi:Uncharacterised protein [Bordetella pertussis]|nr:Uncharacterised protein [Bordetella pertussis]